MVYKPRDRALRPADPPGLPSEEAGRAEEVAANTSAVPGLGLSKRVAPRARKCFSPAPARSWRSSMSDVFTAQRYSERESGGRGAPGQPRKMPVHKKPSVCDTREASPCATTVTCHVKGLRQKKNSLRAQGPGSGMRRPSANRCTQNFDRRCEGTEGCQVSSHQHDTVPFPESY